MGSKRISSFSIILVFTVLALVGVCFIPLLPVKLSPSRSLPEINVRFTMPNNSARIIEMEVTSKLEAMLSRMKDIESIQSTSGNGTGRISVRMNKHADMDMARFEVSTIIRQTWASLPAEVSYPVISVTRSDESANRAFMSYTISAPSNPILIQQFTENQIKPRLDPIEGINRIDVYGSQPMEWQLTYDNVQLQQLGITPGEIQSAINRYLDRIFLGIASIDTETGDNQWLRIAISPEANNQKFDISGIQVKSIDGKLIFLNQLVTASRVERRPTNYFRINGLNSIYLNITADEFANQLELSKKIKTEIARLESSFPAGYEMHLRYDATEFIQKELNKVYFRSVLTLIILLLFVRMNSVEICILKCV
jgi:multidrug efflux pump subunit AcrB